MNDKAKNLKKKKSEAKSNLTDKKVEVENKSKEKFNIYNLLDNKEFLRALKEKLETV